MNEPSRPPACTSAMRRSRCTSSATSQPGASDTATCTRESPSASTMRALTSWTRAASGISSRMSLIMKKSTAWLEGEVVTCVEWMLSSLSHSACVVSCSMPTRSGAHTCSMKNWRSSGPPPPPARAPSAPVAPGPPSAPTSPSSGSSCGVLWGHSSSMRFLSVVQKGDASSWRSFSRVTWNTTKHQLPSVEKSPLMTLSP
mmetsp:Transcript_4565/g.18318  ORF Transcript_4565/g.18318 Transcript_4565/m.18318 type:complete len:200 (+) Transcript_4565:871-1470(+)